MFVFGGAKMNINSKKKIRIIVAVLITFGAILTAIISSAYLRAKANYEQQMQDSDMIRYSQELAIKEMIDDYTDEYVAHTWVFAHQEDNSEQLSDIAAFIVYNTEVPEDIKTSLIEAISDEFSIDKSSITLEYMDYEELKKD